MRLLPPGVLAVPGGALLLLWPALANGYPLLFSDTGAFLAQTLGDWPIWDKPYVYGPLLHLFHARVTLWGPALAQALLLSWLLWRVLRAVRPEAGGAAHLLLVAGLALFTAAPWFASQLMPDILAPALVLALFLLGWAGEALSWRARAGLSLVAIIAAAAHLAHLPIAAGLALVTLALRGPRAGLRCALPLGAALVLLLATNLAVHGRFAL
ncbi:MAG: hypothetical protein K2X74_01925, partial [Acetobacteraceae bacterium]|nr:hypothetical protein [Acetobacteraceae bacterium]